MRKRIGKIIFTVVMLMIAVVIAGILFFYFHVLHYSKDAARESDVAAMQGREWDLLLLSMYSQEEVSAYPFEHYMAYTTYQAEHCFENLADITNYIDSALQDSERVSRVYSLFDPACVNEAFFKSATLTQKAYQKTLKEQIALNSGVEFVFLLPSYSMEYWCELKDEEILEILESYQLFCDEFQEFGNVKIYYFGHLEWLNANPANYLDARNHTAEIVEHLVTMTLAYQDNLVNSEKLAGNIVQLKAQIAEKKADRVKEVDWSDYTICFFGDSIIGNYKGSLSIPGVVGALTGAEVYNCAKGGQKASASEAAPQESFDGTLDFFLAEDKTYVYSADEKFYAEMERFQKADHSGRKLLFFIGYGLNDYFEGISVKDSVEGGDVFTYAGALNAGIARLKTAYPEAEIVLLTSTFVDYYDYGTLAQGNGGVLTDYVNEVKEIAELQGLTYINNYENMGVNRENSAEYLEDGCHLNERGRFEYARHLVECMSGEVGK